MECKYAEKINIDQSRINNLQPLPLYLDCQNEHYEVDLQGPSTFKQIPYSNWIKKTFNKNELSNINIKRTQSL